MQRFRASFLATERARSRGLAVVAALVMALMAPRIYAQVRIAVVDMQRALLDTEDGRRAKAQLKKLFESRQESLNQRQNALKRMKEDIEKQRNTLAREALQKRMDDYQKAFVELQQNYVEYQQELAQKEAELTKQILVNLQQIVRQIGTGEGYTAIMDSGSVIWAPTHLDLTDRVIQQYNQEHPAGSAPTTTPSTTPTTPTTPRTGGRPPTKNTSPHPREEREP